MKSIFKILFPLLILAGGVASFALLKSMGRPPQRLERPHLGPLVEAIEAPAQTVQVVVEGQGTVRPDAQIELVPQVGGVVVWKSPRFEPGGAFEKGELLLRLDARDYELAVRQAEAQVVQARYQLEVARQESEVARQEWQRLHPEQEPPTGLVLRLPQLRAAEANVQAAEARLAEARLRLERTHLRAPFDGRVRSARADVGQHLNAGQPIAQLYSIERAEIVVPVPDEDLAWFTLPIPVYSSSPEPPVAPDRGESAAPLAFARRGASVQVRGTFAGRRHQWQGRVVRTEGELDPQSRMVRLVVEVDDPYGGIAAGAPPLVVGMFVDVAIAGRQVEAVRRLPRTALRAGDTVWIAGTDGRLYIRPAQVLRRMRRQVLARFELGAGERVVISQLSGVTHGMKVRLADAGKEAGP